MAGKYSTVFFDLYGTLIDIHTEENSEAAWTALRVALYREGAQYQDNEQLREQFNREVVRANATRTRTEWFEPDFLPAYRGLLQACWADDSIENARKVAWAFRRGSTTKFNLFPGALDFLEKLKARGLRVALLSNAQACYTRPELQLAGLDDAFDEVILSSDEGVRKPSNELFRRVLIRLDVDPREAVMIGNDARNDILGAYVAGVDGIYLHTDDANPEVCDSAVCSLQGADYAGALDYIDKRLR